MQEKTEIHVLYILTKLELGGAQKVCLSLLEGLQKNGQFSALISGDEGVLVSQAKKFDSVILLKNFKREVGLRNLFADIKTFFILVNNIRVFKKKYKNLVVHTHSTKAGILGRWAAFFVGVKYRVHTVHGFAFHEYQNKIKWFVIYFAEFLTALITTKYVCVSNYDIDIGKKFLPGFAKKNFLIRAAVDKDKFYLPAVKTEFFSEVNTDLISRKIFILGTVSCFKPQKNLFDLLKAFKIVHEKFLNTDRTVFLQIIGDGDLRPDIEKWILENNMKKYIELLGWQEDVSVYLKKWSIFVLSSLWEGLPCSVVEARLSKVPVVSYKIAGIPEVIFDNKNGFLVQAGDFKNLSEKICSLIKNDLLIKKISLYPDNLTDFYNKTMIERHLTLYRDLI